MLCPQRFSLAAVGRAALLAGLALMCGARVQAAAMRPVLALSAAPGARWVEDVEALARLSGVGSLPQTLEAALRQRTRVEKLEGFDPERPWGAILGYDGLLLTPLVMVPVRDGEKLLKSLEPLLGPPQKHEQGYFEVGRRELASVVLLRDGWAWFAQNPKAFASLPDPLAILARRDEERDCDLVLRFLPGHLPEFVRDFGLDLARIGREEAQTRGEKEPETQFRFRSLKAGGGQALTETLLRETREASLAWTFDGPAARATIVARLEPLPDSPLAQRQRGWLQSRSVFGTPPGEAAIDLRLCGPWGRTEAAAMHAAALGLVRAKFGVPPNQRDDAAAECDCCEQAVGLVHELVDRALREAPADAVARIVGQKPPYTLVAGARVVDGAGLVNRVAAAVASCKERKVAEEFRERVAQHGETTVHGVILGSVGHPAWYRELFGDGKEILVAAGKEQVWLAWGPAARNELAAAVAASPPADSNRPAPVVQASLAGGSLLKALEGAERDAGRKALFGLASLQLRPPTDQVRVWGGADAQGLLLRVEAEESVVRAGAVVAVLKTLLKP